MYICICKYIFSLHLGNELRYLFITLTIIDYIVSSDRSIALLKLTRHSSPKYTVLEKPVVWEGERVRPEHWTGHWWQAVEWRKPWQSGRSLRITSRSRQSSRATRTAAWGWRKEAGRCSRPLQPWLTLTRYCSSCRGCRTLLTTLSLVTVHGGESQRHLGGDSAQVWHYLDSRDGGK